MMPDNEAPFHLGQGNLSSMHRGPNPQDTQISYAGKGLNRINHNPSTHRC